MNLVNKNKLQGFWQLMRADRPIGTYLLLWPTVWALLIAAEGFPGWHISFVFVAGVWLMRSAGCVINDYADRNFDGEVKRTALRPLVTGQVAEKEALGLFVCLVLLAFLLVLTLNWQTVALSVVALCLASVYPFMKRYTYLPQFVLGAAFSFSIPMAFMAVSEQVSMHAWALFTANLLWTVAYDTQYAMVDRDDDLQVGIKSTAILFGDHDKLLIGLLQVATLVILGTIAIQVELSWPVYLSLVVCVVLLIQQQWRIRHRQRQACFRAFLDNHYVGMVFALGLAAHYLLIAP